MILALLVGLGAAFGAVARYVLDQAVTRRRGSTFPAGTWLINITGSFILGLLTGLAAHHGLSDQVVTVIGTGVCGGYTTFSTFSLDSVLLIQRGAWGAAAAYMVGSTVLSVLALFSGLWLVRAV